MIEEPPVASRKPPERGHTNLAFSNEGVGTQNQIASELFFHELTLSRKFPIRQVQSVGNIPFATNGLSSDNSGMKTEELRRRVRDRLDQIQLGAIEAAVRVEGLERNYISDFLKGKKRSFSQAKLPLVAEALNLSIQDLIGPTNLILTNRPGSKVSLVPLLDTVTAGRLRQPTSQIPIEDVPLLAFADLGRGEFFALRVSGDSMDRFSPDGSIIVVNKADRDLIDGKCYIFGLNGETTYKIWQGGDQPYLLPHSTNPINRPIFFKRKSDLEVIGRVTRTSMML